MCKFANIVKLDSFDLETNLDSIEDEKETQLIEEIISRMRKLELKERTIRAVVTTDLLPTNLQLEKMLAKLNSWTKPTDELVLATALLISDEE